MLNIYLEFYRFCNDYSIVDAVIAARGVLESPADTYPWPDSSRYKRCYKPRM